jgi:cytochrome c oxidase assembly protein subunit 15
VLRAGRRDLRLLALSQIGGIFGQAIVGGFTVLAKLNPLLVACHFLLSIVLIAATYSLLARCKGERIVSPARSRYISIHTTLTLIVIVAGTLVTGAGPHAGDVDAPRLDIAITTVVAIHGYLVVALILLTIAGIYRKWSKFAVDTQRYVVIFLGACLLQGIVGYAQYLLGVPEILVAAHLLGSSLLWMAAWRIRLTQHYTFSATPNNLE